MSTLYPAYPIIGVGAVVLKNNSILLVRRGNPPGKRLWSVPGGKLNVGEDIREGVARELNEETGLVGEIVDLLDIFQIIIRDGRGGVKYHYVIFDFLIRVNGGALRPGSDALDARFFNLNEALKLDLTKSTRILIEKLKKGSRMRCQIEILDLINDV